MACGCLVFSPQGARHYDDLELFSNRETAADSDCPKTGAGAQKDHEQTKTGDTGTPTDTQNKTRFHFPAEAQSQTESQKDGRAGVAV
jgi:hypothetical protein